MASAYGFLWTGFCGGGCLAHSIPSQTGACHWESLLGRLGPIYQGDSSFASFTPPFLRMNPRRGAFSLRCLFPPATDMAAVKWSLLPCVSFTHRCSNWTREQRSRQHNHSLLLTPTHPPTHTPSKCPTLQIPLPAARKNSASPKELHGWRLHSG